MDSILIKAIKSVQQCEKSYCKFLSANDTKSTKAHQAGYLISKSAWHMFLEKEPEKGENIKVDLTISWQDDFETESKFTYYGAAKNEFRITQFGRNFPFREDRNTGDLFVICKTSTGYYKAYVISHDEDIDGFFDAINITAVETNKVIPKQKKNAEEKLLSCFISYLRKLKVDFPSTFELAANARECYNNSFSITQKQILANPDKEILNWLDAEFQLFKTIENDRYSTRIQTRFNSVTELIEIANTILNRRKSRAGKSLEHHLSEIFTIFGLLYQSQAVTEDNKKPDFLFPSQSHYHNLRFGSDKLIFLASKTTCKDRWRQVLNEADRIKTKHLFTLQQGISKNQLEEMYKYNVHLVVPKPYLSSFPREFKHKILTLDSFLQHVHTIQNG